MNQTQTEAAVRRAMILHEHRRYADAERELRQGLAMEPSHSGAHAMLALCLAEQDRLAEATEEAAAAIHSAPDDPFTHYAMAHVLFKRNHVEEAIAAISQAIALNPYNPAYFALLSALQFEKRQWPAALAAAKKGLEVDPEHDRCVNLRAMALVKLGRRDEAGATINSALQRDPENATTHANQGWTLLHAGKPKEAMLHFREALRLEPDLDWARAGIVEALKAHNIIYRVMLAYFLWMARLGQRAQWGIIVGGYVGYRLLQNLVANQPSLGPLLWPLIIAYMVFAVMTWLADPLFNLLLRLHPLGRHALSRVQTMAANCIGLLLAASLVCICLGLSTANATFLALGIGLAVMLIPVSGTFKVPAGWPRVVLTLYTCALAAVLAAQTTIFWSLEHSNRGPTQMLDNLQNLFVFGILAYGFLANALISARVRR
ncbi:MAG TPA: tetratricopeptide repeat protein [Humisphaera sp.]|jgi:tetratricopeptide (TPR) repeat protein|nr:tetratricopeptide repeat protein [Humisphaera sp.]